jgi:hypothetical protein
VSKTQIRLLALGIPAAWAAINSVMYAADTTNRHRAESAWFLFSAVLLIAAVWHPASAGLFRDSRSRLNSPAKAERFTITLIASLAVAFALYFPMLSIGLLSDDFVLVARARGGVLVDANWDYLRPLPIGIWRLLIELSGATAVAVVLHGLNIGLHGVNAWLTGILATRFGLDSRSALLAGFLFLVFPASVEPVVWTSGVFDVLLVTWILAAGIAITSATNRSVQTIATAILTSAALATKETAVALPALLAIAAYASPSVTLKRAAIPIAASIVLVGLYVVVRVAAGFETAPPSGEFTGYAAKELFSRPLGGLGLPFHIEVLSAHRWIPYALALYWPALFLSSAARWHEHERDGRTILALGAWIIVSVAPLATMLYIAEDLQGARYLYIGTVAWSVMIVVLVQRVQPALRLVAIVPLLVVFAFATRAHQSAWAAAAVERDRVLDAYRSSDVQCTPTEIRGLPDQIRGAYLFRNGVPEAIASVTPPTTASPRCVLVWDGTRFIQE